MITSSNSFAGSGMPHQVHGVLAHTISDTMLPAYEPQPQHLASRLSARGLQLTPRWSDLSGPASRTTLAGDGWSQKTNGRPSNFGQPCSLHEPAGRSERSGRNACAKTLGFPSGELSTTTKPMLHTYGAVLPEKSGLGPRADWAPSAGVPRLGLGLSYRVLRAHATDPKCYFWPVGWSPSIW